MYHVHVYFNTAAKDKAMTLRQKIAADFPKLTQGRVHDAPVGPHPMGSFLVIVPDTLLYSFRGYLNENHDGLSILIHPETGDDHHDHAESNILWVGTPQNINRDIFGPKP